MADFIYKNNRKNLKYPPDLDDKTVHPASIHFKFFESRDAMSSDVVQDIFLYMPEQVDQPSTVNLGATEFGFVGNTAATAAAAGINSFRGGGGLAASLAAAGSTAKGVAEDALGLAAAYGLSNIGAAAVNALGGNVTGSDLMARAGNIAPNPYITAIFKSIGLREFMFKFTFYPFQASDCDIIYNIIASFREHYLPGFDKDMLGDGDNSALLSLPHYAEIEYLLGEDRNKWLPRFKRAAMTYLDIDYTGQGMFAQMRNGFPAEITMVTKLQEIEILTRTDVSENY